MAYTTIDDPTIYFNTVLFTGTASGNKAVTGVGFQPDFVWTKNRVDAYGHNLYDSVRGTGKYLQSNGNSAESSSATSMVSFDSDGFTVGTGDNVQYSSNNGVSWNWKAGTAFSNDASATGIGSIDSSGSINTTAGFSIITYTGTGSSATVGHGLGAVPKAILFKKTSGAQGWGVYHAGVGNTGALRLDGTDATDTTSNYFNNTSPTSSVFTVNTNNSVNNSGGTMLAYCFAEKKGYSKFGNYTGNGGSSGVNNADGTFVFTGFSPAWIMIKRTDSAQQWGIADSKRDVDNPVQHHLFAESNQADSTSSYNNFDFLSNGFKLRSGDQWTNASGGTYIYMAFAESPFVSSGGIPCTAR